MKKDFLSRNIGLKLASLVLAVTLWFFVILSGRSGTVVEIPVMYVNVPQGLEVTDFPKTLSINVEGQERILKNLKRDEISAVVDLRDAKTGRNFYSLTAENIRLPSTLEATNIDPQTISLTLEKQFKRTVSVQPAIEGLPERGYVILEIRVDPETLVLEGPRSIVSKVHNIKTEPIDISGLNRDLQYKAKLNLPNSGLRADVQKVDVTILVKQIK
ncbi:MAG: YbbR-like domain-containing protein [Nitrospiraceae bacterium]|nr:MAG: YbbR-like domain-containing protein [Nitrospiraceae bacterium]